MCLPIEIEPGTWSEFLINAASAAGIIIAFVVLIYLMAYDELN
jgi:hypothetical protein